MSDWDLDLRDAEEQMDEAFAAAGDVVLGVLDGTTDPRRVGPQHRLRQHPRVVRRRRPQRTRRGFAREVKDMGGELMHFRGFLVVTPPGVTIDTDRLSE